MPLPRLRSSLITPQWPVLVYSQRHTSVMTNRSTDRFLISRIANCTGPSSDQASEPCSSFFSGRPWNEVRYWTPSGSVLKGPLYQSARMKLSMVPMTLISNP